MDYSNWLMVLDLDGTLLNSRRNISDENKAAIEEWKALGGRVCLASGRSAGSIYPYWRELGLRLPVICGNGSGIYDFVGGGFIHHINLPSGGAALAAAADAALPETGITIYKDGKVYFCKINAVTERNLSNENLPPLYADYRSLPEPWEKILFSQEPEHTPEVAALMEKLADKSKFRLLLSAPVYFEVLSPEANKGVALRKYCELLGFELSKTVAVGDNENDVMMLADAALSFTVANCTEPAREAADRVVGSNDESCVRQIMNILEGN